MNSPSFLFAMALLALAHGQVDPGAGTFVCRPCARQECYLSNTNHVLSVSGLGTKTCGEFQEAADDRSLFPDECAAIQAKTLATSDPCGCKRFDGSDCPPAGFTNTQTCNLCGDNQRIGDPHRIIQSGLLDGSECIVAFDFNEQGAFANSNCAAAGESIREWCSCVPPGQSVKQCIPQEDGDYPCNVNDPTDVCCDGTCRFRLSEFEFVCTNKPAEPVHPAYTPPGPPPPPPVPSPPSPRPTASPVLVLQPPRPTGFFQTPPGEDECDPLQGCDSTGMKCAFIGGQYASYKCISKTASSKQSQSLSGGGGAGGSAKQDSGV